MSSPQIFKATYSGVPVYEMMCKNIAVMRRQADSYINATQILKVADFDKPQRTRILEREIQTGQHEKVQGGYGKYQGTWVPLERAKSLAEQYQVTEMLRPILEFVRGDQSPPLAPRHVTAASTRTNKPRETRVRKRPRHFESEDDSSQYSDLPLDDARSPRSLPLTEDRRKRTASPARGWHSRRRVHETSHAQEPEEADEATYSQILVEHFTADESKPPALLLHPPRGFDVNMIIDDDGHTCLHWAAAMAQIGTVELLIQRGADIDRVNYEGQTALMRSALFAHNYERNTFGELVNILKKTILHIDANDRTVFHHVVAAVQWKGKAQAATYYLGCLVDKLTSNRPELISILNVKDKHGDTALTIASRVGNKKLVRLLVNAGASTEIANDEGMTSQDYLSEFERRSEGENEQVTRDRLRHKIESIYKSMSGNESRNGSHPSLSHTFDEFATSYERDLLHKDELMRDKKMELDLMQKRLNEAHKAVKRIHVDESALQEHDLFSQKLESQLRKLVHYTQKEALATFVQQSETMTAKDTTRASHPESSSPSYLQALCHELHDLQQKRVSLERRIIQHHAQVASTKLQGYKRLIAMCCNVPYENIDAMLSPLWATIEAKQRQHSVQ